MLYSAGLPYTAGPQGSPHTNCSSLVIGDPQSLSCTHLNQRLHQRPAGTLGITASVAADVCKRALELHGFFFTAWDRVHGLNEQRLDDSWRLLLALLVAGYTMLLTSSLLPSPQSKCECIPAAARDNPNLHQLVRAAHCRFVALP